MDILGFFSRVMGTAQPADAPVRTNDSIINAAARLGLGADTLASQSTYAYTTISRNRQVLDNAYRGSWLVGVAVDSVADDMTRTGVEMMGDIDPRDIEAVQSEFTALSLWGHVGNVARWARLYGGAIGVLLVDGQDVSTELRVDTIRAGQFRGMLVLDRWMVTPSQDDVVTEFGPDMGQPRYYQVNSSGAATGGYGGASGGTAGPVSGTFSGGATSPGAQAGVQGVRIHYTRVLRLDGSELPFYARQGEQGWGQSVVERLYDRLVAYDSATQGAAQLVYKAHLRTLQVEGLREAIAFGGKALEGVVQQIDLIRRFQSNDGMTLLDKTDTFSVHQYAFAGLPELLSQFSEQLSGSLGIPLVRLFGQSPAGFSNGEADLENYADMIASQQESKLRRPVGKLLDMVHRSKLGRPLPPGFGFRFAPLRKMSPVQKSEIAGRVTTAVVAAQGAGIVSQKVAMEELRQSSHLTGVFTNISNEDIDAAESDPPEAAEALIEPEGEEPGEDGAREAPSVPPTRQRTRDADFEENDHPRDDDGRFARSGSAGGGSGQREGAGQTRTALVAAKVQDGKLVAADGSPLPPHIAAAGIPPGWTDVRYAAEPGAKLLATGRDKKGRAVSVYSAEFSATQSAEKFDRVRTLDAQMDRVAAQNRAAQASSNPRTRDAADCLALIVATGVRPGSDADTGAEKKAYGATTLQGRHVVHEAGATRLRFTGKKGVDLDIPVGDRTVAADLLRRAASAGPDGKLFPLVSHKSLLDHTHTLGDGTFKTKDFRTHLGTSTARALVDAMPVPKNAREHKQAVLEVAKQVSQKLGNTPTIALQSYINPTVFSAWVNGNVR